LYRNTAHQVAQFSPLTNKEERTKKELHKKQPHRSINSCKEFGKVDEVTVNLTTKESEKAFPFISVLLKQ